MPDWGKSSWLQQINKNIHGNAAQVRVKDAYGQQHYVMVEPDSDDVLKQGDAVLLVSLDGNTFKAILNPSGSLVD